MSKQSRRPNRAARHQTPPPAGMHQGGWHPSRNTYWLFAAVAAAALLGATFLVGKGSNANAAGPVEVGQKAPAVTGRDVVSGREITAAQLRHKNVLYYLNEGVMCQACLVQIQTLEQRARDLRQRGLTLVSITNDDAATLAAAARDYKITTPLLADSSRQITKSFGVLGGVPFGVGMHTDTANHTFVLVDRSGTVRFVRDYPNMWVDVSTLLRQLPRLA